ncbi:MAG TPA: host attachment protein [Rudaea sp.]|nr:host attachment protein [Rudaea sp.]
MNEQIKTTWILVASLSRARLFELGRRNGDFELFEIATFLNPDARGRDRDQVTDRLPRVNESMNATRHAIDPHTSLREKSANQFAQELDEALDNGRVTHRYERLVLIALPEFLGTLHARLNRHVCERIVAEVQHELTTKSPEEIRSYLPSRLYV